MGFSWLASIFYGLAAGFAEFLPISALAHHAMLQKIFGVGTSSPLLRLMLHLGAVAGLFVAYRPQIDHLNKEQRLAKVPRRRRRREPERKAVFDVQILKTALVPALLGFVLYYYTYSWQNNLGKIAGMLLLNGIVLILPRLLPSANKDSRSMSGLDGLIIGIFSGLGMVPGLSRLGFATTAAQIRGGDRRESYTWSILLGLPIMIILVLVDFYMLFTTGVGALTFMIFVKYLFSAVVAGISAYFAILLMRFLEVNSGFAGFSYYSWGAALFAFILYLTI